MRDVRTRSRISGSFIGFDGADGVFGGAFAAFDARGVAIKAKVSAISQAMLRVADWPMAAQADNLEPRTAMDWASGSKMSSDSKSRHCVSSGTPV